MNYRQLNLVERTPLATLRRLGFGLVAIGLELGRHRSTLWRELRRNATPHDGGYRVTRAQERAVARRRRARRNSQFDAADRRRSWRCWIRRSPTWLRYMAGGLSAPATDSEWAITAT